MLISAMALFCLLAAAEPSASQKPADGPAVKFDDPFIEKLVGKWNISRSIHGHSSSNKAEAKWVLGHQFLELSMVDVAVPPTYEALVLIGYSHADDRYVAYWCDTFGGKYSGMGYGHREGNSVEFKFQFDDGPFFNRFTWSPTDQTWTFAMEGQDSQGHRKPFGTDVLRRTAAETNSTPAPKVGSPPN